ncbi:alpha/beta-hydrolase [Serendipita vermifera]|nr:alpha/beta-hydrolase [Serendipita vermifera]
MRLLFTTLIVLESIICAAASLGRRGEAPHSYPGIPTTPYGTEWQAYFKVDSLPNITIPTPSLYAGSVSVNRTNSPNNSLFFMAVGLDADSLTAADGERNDTPWIIYLNGGPGASSLSPMFSGLSPFYVLPSNSTPPSFTESKYSWNRLADVFFVDQPVGTGYSTVEDNGYPVDNDEIGLDFVNFLSNLVKVFPSLRRRPLHLIGESYGGTWVPYIAKAIFAQAVSPVHLEKAVIGSGVLGNWGAWFEYSTLNILHSYPQLVGFNTNAYEYFVEQYNLCGYNVTLKYPALEPYPVFRIPAMASMGPPCPKEDHQMSHLDKRSDDFSWFGSPLGRPLHDMDIHNQLMTLLRDYKLAEEAGLTREDTKWKRQSADESNTIANGPIGRLDDIWGCGIAEEIISYALNESIPWSGCIISTFFVFFLFFFFFFFAFHCSLFGLGLDRSLQSIYPDTQWYYIMALQDAIFNRASGNMSSYLNDPAVRAAIHAPEKEWLEAVSARWNTSLCSENVNAFGDPSPEPQTFIDELSNNVTLVFYSGNTDGMVGHRGTELAIQNMTFGGIRGFVTRPSTPWSDMDGNFAGVIHQERNVTYALFDGAGHGVWAAKPKAMYAFLEQFVLGKNETGRLSVLSDQTTSIVGGIHTEYLKGVITGSEVYTGTSTTEGTYTWAESYWNAWNSYLVTRTAADVPVASASGDGILPPGFTGQIGDTSSAPRSIESWMDGWKGVYSVLSLFFVTFLFGI